MQRRDWWGLSCLKKPLRQMAAEVKKRVQDDIYRTEDGGQR